MGAGLPVKRPVHPTSMQADPPLSRASFAPTEGTVPNTSFLPIEDPVWERACPRRGRYIQHPGKLTHHYREQALLPQRELCRAQVSCPLKIQCGSKACPRRGRHIQHPGKLTHRYREQALLPQRKLCQTQVSCPLKIQCGSKACPRWRRYIQHPGKLTHRYREQARSHSELFMFRTRDKP